MHDIPNTEDTDAEAEKFWPEGYKSLIRDELKLTLAKILLQTDSFRGIYRQRFAGQYKDLEHFLIRLAGMIAIGAENGADEAFDELIRVRIGSKPHLEIRSPACYLLENGLPFEFRKKLHKAILDEYSKDHGLEHLYQDFYSHRWKDYPSFLAFMAELVVFRAARGADEMFHQILGTFIIPRPLPPARRYSRRVKI